jgi:hypothetical protein
MIYAVRKLHTVVYDLKQSAIYKLNFLEAFTLLLLYFFIQLNFDLVSHNFGTRSDQFIDSTHFLLGTTLGLIYFSWRTASSLTTDFLVSALLLGSPNRINLNCVLRNKVKQKVMALLILSLLYMSFNNLLNDFFWKTFSINIVNTSHQFPFIVTIIITLLLVTS